MTITVYTSNTCPGCSQVKDYLQLQGYDYIEKSVTNKDFRNELLDMGFMRVPVVMVDDETIGENVLENLKNKLEG